MSRAVAMPPGWRAARVDVEGDAIRLSLVPVASWLGTDQQVPLAADGRRLDGEGLWELIPPDVPDEVAFRQLHQRFLEAVARLEATAQMDESGWVAALA